MPHLLLSAAHKSSGKTMIALGLAAALRERGLTVQPFKKGPDYIDPMWLGMAAGRACYNLDFHTTAPEAVQALFARQAAGAALSLVEGNKGLHDGMALDGSDSNAALAKLLGTPVVLVLDTRGMTRGVAPLVLGFQGFDRGVRLAGLILNQVGGARHEAKLRAALERYADVPVLGAVRRDPALVISERHLGLVPSNEHELAREMVSRIRQAIAAQVDLDALIAVAARAPPVPVLAEPRSQPGPRVRIAIARDTAFGFYYQDDLDALEAAGAELIAFDTLHDADLPPADGLIIGGGFPETHARELAANISLRRAIRDAVEAGMPAYAECGGLMYLCRSVRWGDASHEMAGVLPADVVMGERPQGRGYVRLAESREAPWPAPGHAGAQIPAHEFHYSRLTNLEARMLHFAYKVKRGVGIDGERDGIVYKNLLASYSHLRNTAGNRWTDRFLAFVRLHVAGARGRA
jgi:cobyrinic acid a,c-diamide synthase